jgi:hypothetical protein
MRFLARTNDDLKKNTWDNFNFFTYIKLNEKSLQSKSAIEDLEKKMQAIYKKNEAVLKVAFILQPLAEIHLYSNFLADIPGHGNAQNVYIFWWWLCLSWWWLALISESATARAARAGEGGWFAQSGGCYKTTPDGPVPRGVVGCRFISTDFGTFNHLHRSSLFQYARGKGSCA